MSDKQCPRCQLWNSESARRCDCGYDFTTGQTESSYIDHQSKYAQDNVPIISADNIRLASPILRLINFIVDYVLLLPCTRLIITTGLILEIYQSEQLHLTIRSYIIGLSSLFFSSEGFRLSSTWPYVISLFFLFLYYFIFEALLQRTPAKFVTRTRVVMWDGSKPSIGAIALRTLIRLVPFEFISLHNGTFWHDRWSKTRVIKGWKEIRRE